MSEYLSKKAVLEWFDLMHLEYSHNAAVSEFIESGIEIFESGALDADDSEIQRLRTAAIKLHETLNTYWQGDCDKADVVAAQSKLCDVLGVDRDDELYGDWTDERCPKCGANLLGNKVGDKWCSMVGCDYGLRETDSTVDESQVYGQDCCNGRCEF